MSDSNELPANIVEILAEHVAQYRRDPQAAHLWDSGKIGLKGGLVPTLLLRTRGRKSGKDRYVTLQYYRPRGQYVVVGSKGGVEDHPVWFKNLLEEPHCHITVGAFESDSIARVATGAEREELWAIVSEEQPAYKRYQKRTSREIPVVIFDLA